MNRLHLGALAVTSPAFDHGGAIPERHTADGHDVSPALRWANVPERARQLALVCHDPDAPLTHGFTHWVLYGIDPHTTGLPEGDDTYVSGLNDFGELGYGGPAPPVGHGVHHYYFHLYALDTAIDSRPGLSRAELLDRIDDRIIEQARIVGTYRR